MKKEKTDLEQLLSRLLNDLLRMGWKPFNRYKTLHIDCYDKCKGLNYKWIHLDGGFMNEESRTLRELVSIDSGLWQFVCENGLLNVNKKYEWEYWTQSYKRDGVEYTHEFSRWCEKYRIIESSLKDESELEDFLLSNIVIKNEK